MKILILNWRDPKSPLEGGAERFTQKYGEYWASLGHEVVWLTNGFSGAKKQELIKGINYLRIGPNLDGTLLKYLFYYPFYLFNSIIAANNLNQEKKFDLVIDEIHGLPFFTPFYSKARNVLLVCEVAGPIWDKMFPFPINVIGKYAEKLIYQIYKKTEIWAISENTKNNILELLPGKEIKVIDLGVDENLEILAKIKNIKKTAYPSAIFLARLVKMKGIEAAIEATAEIVKVYPDFKLFVVGSGIAEYEGYLKKYVSRLDVNKNIEFVGFKDGLEKYKLLKSAHFLFHPSFKEGFGLTVIEAGLVGTPSIVRSGSSLDLLVKNSVNGYLFDDENEIAKLVTKMCNIKNYSKLQDGARKKSAYYLWQNVLKRSIPITNIK